MNVVIKMINKNRISLFLILLGLSVRLLFSFLPGFQIDVTAWFAWAERLNQLGFASFYSEALWTNYTPGFLYMLAFLGFIKNLFLINDSLFYLILKLPSILAEIGLGIFVYKLISNKSKSWATLATILILLNPAFIFNSSIWGQIDGLLSLLMIVSIYYLSQKKLIYSSIFFGLSFLVKPQAIVLLPVFITSTLKDKSLKSFSKFFGTAMGIIFILSIPFFIISLFGLPKLFLKMIADYPYTSLFAYNFWGAIGFWVQDEKLWQGLELKSWGYILLGLFYLPIIYLFFKKKISLWIFVSLSLLSFYFLPTRIHERYLYPALVSLIITATLLKSRLILLLTIILSFMHFLNLYYVYVYYNEFYLNMPKLLYNSTVFNFIQNNGKNLSIISTAIFIIISYVLIKSSYDKKS